MNDKHTTSAPAGKAIWTSRLTIAGIVITIAGFLCAPAGLSPLLAMSVLLLGSVLVIVAGVIAIIGLIRGGTAAAAPISWVAIILAVAALANGGSRMGGGGAPIHDITTDTLDPPEFIETAKERTPEENPAAYSGSESAEIQLAAYPDIETIVLLDPRSFVFQIALETANDMGWDVVAADAETGHIEATASTPFVGFKDDVVIRIRTDGAETLVDVRSKSRIGRGDMGVNAARIRQFRDKLNQAASP
jgi:hypothetical protein